ncbi:MAG: hypothetical protein K6E47_04530 [Lachnospiraceae bacterium]|nr:hypothetical protein [Lachnospiraceae bacterium]
MFYLIEETLKEIKKEELKNTDKQYVAVLSSDEWKQDLDSFEMGMDIDPDMSEMDIFNTFIIVGIPAAVGYACMSIVFLALLITCGNLRGGE